MRTLTSPFGHSVMLAMAATSGKDVVAYKWTLDKFQRLMGVGASSSRCDNVLSDSDDAIASAVQQSMPDAHHGLCVVHLEWNLRANAYSHGASKVVADGCVDLYWDAVKRSNSAKHAEHRVQALSSYISEKIPALVSYFESSFRPRLLRSIPALTGVFSAQAMATQRTESAQGDSKRSRHRSGVRTMVSLLQYTEEKIKRVEKKDAEEFAKMQKRRSVAKYITDKTSKEEAAAKRYKVLKQ